MKLGGGGAGGATGSLVIFLTGAVAGFLLADELGAEAKSPAKRRGNRAATPTTPAPAPDDNDQAAVLGGSSAHGHTPFFRRVSPGHFVAEHDPRTRTPRWVAEVLTRESLRGGHIVAERDGRGFREDAAIPPHLRARLADYAGSGYDRGHLAPAADHKGDELAMSDSFLLTNVAPQDHALNRDWWARLERWVRHVVVAAAAADGDEATAGGAAASSSQCRVVTGPLYLPEWEPSEDGAAAGAGAGKGGGRWRMRHPVLGEPLHWVHVPTHFFKVVLTGGGALGAFVVPNKPIAPNTPLSAFVVPVRAVEAAAGLTFFPGLVSEEDKLSADEEIARDGAANALRVMAPRGKGQGLGLERGRGGEDGGGARRPRFALETAAAARPLRHLCGVVPCELPAAWAEWERGGGSGRSGPGEGEGEGEEAAPPAAAAPQEKGKRGRRREGAAPPPPPPPPADRVDLGIETAVRGLGKG